MRRELTFLLAIWKANLLSVMEYRVAFITQVVGMILNNAVYFLFWVIYFDRFQQVRGWQLSDMFILFGVVASGFGMGVYLFGNVQNLAETISTGKLDYYLSMPRPVLLHTLASHSVASGMGDFLYGIISFLLARQLGADSILRFIFGVIFSTTVFVSFLVLVQSLAFWMGSAQMLTEQAFNAIITFSLYPITLFDGTAKLILFTVIPAAFVGALPAEFVRSFSWERLAVLAASGTFLLVLAVFMFERGLRRYESGSAISNQV